MQKPTDKGRIEALVADIDNVDDLSTSEMSVPKGQIRVSNEQVRIPSSKLPFKPTAFQHRANPVKNAPAAHKVPLDSKSKPTHIRSPSEQVKLQDKIALQPVTAKQGMQAKPQKFYRSPPSDAELAALSCNSLSPTTAKTLEERALAPCSIISPKGPTSRIDKAKQFATGKIKVKGPETCQFCNNNGNSQTRKRLSEVIYDQLYKKYEATTQNTYNINIVNDIILNANTRIVAIFKEYLIYDDLTDFLKVYYNHKEAAAKLKQVTDFYDKSSKVFPNYIALEEKKYMFKNIEKKQKAIDLRHKLQANPKPNPGKNNKLFTRKFLDEITMRCSRMVVNEKSNLAELVDKFIDRDSMSQIHKSNCESIEATFCALKAAGKGNVAQEIQKMIQAVKKPAVVAKINNFVGGERRATPMLAEKTHKKHGQSQEDLLKVDKAEPKLMQGFLSGRMSAAGNYCSHSKDPPNKGGPSIIPRKAERNSKPLTTNQNVRIPQAAKVAVNNIDPLQININLNLILNKEKSRSGTPHTCTAADVYRYKSLEKLQGNIETGIATSRAHATNKPSIGAVAAKKNSIGIPKVPSTGAKVEVKKPPRSITRPRQEPIIPGTTKASAKMDRVASGSNLLSPKFIEQRSKGGRESTVPQPAKKIAMDQICKNIKDLLGPMGMVGLTNSIVPVASRLSPRKDKFGREQGEKITSNIAVTAGVKGAGTFLQRKSEAGIAKHLASRKK